MDHCSIVYRGMRKGRDELRGDVRYIQGLKKAPFSSMVIPVRSASASRHCEIECATHARRDELSDRLSVAISRGSLPDSRVVGLATEIFGNRCSRVVNCRTMHAICRADGKVSALCGWTSAQRAAKFFPTELIVALMGTNSHSHS